MDRRVVLSSEDLPERSGGTLVFGHFNLIHPGHLRFLKYAKSIGEPLIVAVLGDADLSPTERSHYYPEEERVAGVAALGVVDLVVELGSARVTDAVQRLNPDVLLLGDEHLGLSDPSISEAVELQRALGGEVRFHAGETRYATAEFLQYSPEDLEVSRATQFQASCARQGVTGGGLRRALDGISRSSVLVVGDTIVDSYVACDPIGMSAEAPVIVVRELESREFVGGASVVAAHMRSLGAEVHYLSVVGDDAPGEYVREQLSSIGVQSAVAKDISRPTTYKTRYMVENQKLFRVSRLQEHEIDDAVEAEILQRLRELAPTVDAVVVSDFVYGVITPKVLVTIQELQHRHGFLTFADLQCSSQVGNVGKFSEMSVLCPTEREARIALNSRSEGLEWVATRLMESTKSDNLVLKMGQDGFVTYATGEDGFVNREHFPALSTDPLDLAGAGDSLLATLSCAMAGGATAMEASALGAIVASIVVRTVGNQPVSRSALERTLTEMGFDK